MFYKSAALIKHFCFKHVKQAKINERSWGGQIPWQKVAVCTGQLAGDSLAFTCNHTVFTIEEDLEFVSKLDFFLPRYLLHGTVTPILGYTLHD